jgi:hypothetical protein
VVVAGLLAVPVLGAQPAQAKPGEVITLACGGTTYQAAVNGNGQWSPARDLGSTKVFVPHAFGPFTGTIRDASGTVIDTSTDPAVVQGSGKQKNDVSCTYSFTFVSDGSDPDFPAGWTFSGVGTVTGQATPG